jgi:cytochrome b561
VLLMLLVFPLGWGHVALYGLMFCVPLFALLRQYGSGRELVVFGMQLMPGFSGEKIEWLLQRGGGAIGAMA